MGIFDIFKRDPDFYIGGKQDPYLLRWWIIPRNPWFNIYLHKFLRDDEDRALHDHPWWNVSLILKGGYTEHVPDGGFQRRKTGQIVVRAPYYTHRIELLYSPEAQFNYKQPAWTLFITGPRVREWGFHCPKGWVHWQIFTNPNDSSVVGRGCD